MRRASIPAVFPARKLRYGTLLLAMFGLSAWIQAAPLTVTINATQNNIDNRSTYNGQALQLALEKTRAEFGDYRLVDTKLPMNTARALAEAEANTIPNLVVLTTFQNWQLEKGLDYARFPNEYGITGYRICFVSPKAKAAVARASSLEELREFTIGQGKGWADTTILRSNGFKVVEIGVGQSLYRMVAASRIDLFCRGVNELEPELKSHSDIANLDYDRTFALVYDLPRFYVANKRNTALLQRIAKGLARADQDGSLYQLWEEQYGSALRFANLKQRKLYRLATPNIDGIDFDYKKYYFDPSK